MFDQKVILLKELENCPPKGCLRLTPTKKFQINRFRNIEDRKSI